MVCVFDEVARVDDDKTDGMDGDFQRTFAHLGEMDVKCVAFRAATRDSVIDRTIFAKIEDSFNPVICDVLRL